MNSTKRMQAIALFLFPVVSSFQSPTFVSSVASLQATIRSHHSILPTAKKNDRVRDLRRFPFVMQGQKDDSDEDTDNALIEAEDEAAFDAHDLSDPGMEAAALERAVVMAEELAENRQKDASDSTGPNEGKKWNDEHLAHGASDVHIETDGEVEEAEDEAAFDAHDLSDPGMEAAALERAVMMAEELAEKGQNNANKSNDTDEGKKWNDEHLAHGASDVHIETDEEVEEAEEEVAFDAHDLSDPGMEAAALERSLMMAEEWAEKGKNDANDSTENDTDEGKKWNDEHLAQGASDIHIETKEEVEEAEEEVAFDAHDLSDPGMEAAAMERSLMMAEEWAAKMKKKAEGEQK